MALYGDHSSNSSERGWEEGDSIQHETDVVLPEAARRGNDTRRERTGTVRVVHTPRKQVAVRQAGAQPYPNEVFLSFFRPLSPFRSLELCLPARLSILVFAQCSTVPAPRSVRLSFRQQREAMIT